MKEQLMFMSIIGLLIGVIIYLGYMLLKPPVVEPEMNFERLMELTSDLRNSLSEVNITYLVNLSLPTGMVVGEMNYYKNETDKIIHLSDELRDYEGYALMLGPEQVINFIQEGDRQEYSGEWMNYNLSTRCWTTITEPAGDYQQVISGEYLFLTCFDKEIGYPTVSYNSEVAGEDVVYSELYITNYTYTKA